MSPNIAWGLLVLSGITDVAWALATKRADGFQNLGWVAVSLFLLAVFVTLLTKALQILPLGTAYAVWTGIGMLGSVVVGIVCLGENASPIRLLCIATIAIGIIGLKLLPS
jgi:quaternary ammonium compound-resistance protein SugE